ncbi:MAG: acetate--CoA ligase family protein [Gammaproteobacteria bacterium]|nr:acetate--CoA ligase family protein [Gammaproteobacteria bacterium]
MIGWAEQLLNARHVAVIGASNTEGKLGYLFMQNLVGAYPGTIYPINPGQDLVHGLKAYPSIKDVPCRVDLAILTTPPGATPRVIEDCVAAGTATAVIIGGGFAETGEKGVALEKSVADIAGKGRLRLLGPNCFGVINTHLGLNASLGLGLPEQGGVSLITQSGAYGMAAFTRSKLGEIGFAKVIAPGNKIDINEIELLSFLRNDPDTRVIAMLIESISDGRELFEEINRTAQTKPVVIMKTGRTDSGQRAAASHTAALAGDYAVTAAALRQAGAYLVTDGQTLLDTAAALDKQSEQRGKRVAIISNSGGTGVELTDLLTDHGLEVPALSAGLQEKIRAVLPEQGSAVNPVDVTTQWPRFPEMYGSAIRELMDCDEVDIILPVLLQRSALMPEVSERVILEYRSAQADNRNKPLHVCWVAGPEADANKMKLQDSGIPVHPWPLRTAKTIAACTGSKYRKIEPAGNRRPRPETVTAGEWAPADVAFSLLQEQGIGTAPWRYVTEAADLGGSADDLAYPLVIKAVRPELLHKSDAGAVKLGISSAEELISAAQEMETAFGRGPYLVQQQVTRGVELLLGATRDRNFGPVITFGIGGTMVEVFKDVALRLAPVGTREAYDMLDEIRGQQLLDGYRGSAPVSRDALARFIAGFSRWIDEAAWIEEVDMNPVIADGDDFTVVDVRIFAGGV